MMDSRSGGLQTHELCDSGHVRLGRCGLDDSVEELEVVFGGDGRHFDDCMGMGIWDEEG